MEFLSFERYLRQGEQLINLVFKKDAFSSFSDG
jgi:hypothetical protein